MLHAPAFTAIDDPGPLRVSGGVRMGMLAMSLLAVAGFFIANGAEHGAPFHKLLVNFLFFFLLAIGGMLFTAIHHVSGAKWSTPVRRLAEGMTSFLPWAILILIAVLFGTEKMYDWAPADAKYPYAHSLKDAWLSKPFFWGRVVLFAALMVLFARAFVGNSLKQDATKSGEYTGKNYRLAILFLIVFAYAFTIFAMDMVMSLQSKFFSTMFGIYLFAGAHLSGMAVLVLMVLALRKGAMGKYVQKFCIRDLGTWLMGFATFMMYVGFSQFMLIWYANLQDETFYFMQRMEKGWEFHFLLLPLLKWIVPFFGLMPNTCRSHPLALTVVCVSILLGQWLDLYWLVMPTAPGWDVWHAPGISDVLLFLGVGGLFGFSLLTFYSKNSVMPVGDPNLLMSVNGEHLQ